MTAVLLVDGSAAVTELVANALVERTGWTVDRCATAADVERLVGDREYDLAIVDLSFTDDVLTGLDALVLLARLAPATRLTIITQGDDWGGDALRDAWEMLPVATVISKSAPLDHLIAMAEEVLATGMAPADPAIQPLLPPHRDARRAAAGFGSLVRSADQARLWTALICAGVDASYRGVALASGMSFDTTKAVRSQLLAPMRLRGLDDPSPEEMQELARRSRPFLEPFLPPGVGAGT